jgi:hypothetical protein
MLPGLWPKLYFLLTYLSLVITPITWAIQFHWKAYVTFIPLPKIRWDYLWWAFPTSRSLISPFGLSLSQTYKWTSVWSPGSHFQVSSCFWLTEDCSDLGPSPRPPQTFLILFICTSTELTIILLASWPNQQWDSLQTIAYFSKQLDSIYCG